MSEFVRQVPEVWDGGFWYAIPAKSTDTGGYSVGVNGSWCATYAEIHGVMYAAVRFNRPVLFPATDVTVREVLAEASVAGMQPVLTKPAWRASGR